MIKTKEEYVGLQKLLRDESFTMLIPDEAEGIIKTIEALRPFYRLARESLILTVASAIVCGSCANSWTPEGKEIHEEGCILYGMPEWLADND